MKNMELRRFLKFLVLLFFVMANLVCTFSNNYFLINSKVNAADPNVEELGRFIDCCEGKILYLKSEIRANPPVLPKDISGVFSWAEVCGMTFGMVSRFEFENVSQKEQCDKLTMSKVSAINSRILKKLLYIESVFRCFSDIVRKGELYDLDRLKTFIEQSLDRLETFIFCDCKSKDLDDLLDSVYKVLPVDSLRYPNLEGKFLINYIEYSRRTDGLSRRIANLINGDIRFANHQEVCRIFAYCYRIIEERLISYSIFTHCFRQCKNKERYCNYIDSSIELSISILENSLNSLLRGGKTDLKNAIMFIDGFKSGIESIIDDIALSCAANPRAILD